MSLPVSLAVTAALSLAGCSKASGRGAPAGSGAPPQDPLPAASSSEPVASSATLSAASVDPPPAPPAPCEDLVEPGSKPLPPPALPRADRLRGVDVSSPAPWKAIRDAGFAFAFVGATHGLTKIPSFAANWAMTKRCQLPRGAYHFLTEKADGAAQARAFLEMIDGDPGELPPVIDLEESKCECCALSCSDWTRLATAFVEAVTAKLSNSKKPIFYVVEPFFNQCLCGTFKFREHPLWLAGWPKFDFAEKVRTGGFGRWTFYQHAGNVRVGGAAVDLDVFRGTRGDLDRFIATGALPE